MFSSVEDMCLSRVASSISSSSRRDGREGEEESWSREIEEVKYGT